MTSLSNQHQNFAPRTVRRRVRRIWFLLEFLVLTSAVATSAGVGFGVALRLNRPIEAGSTILHSEQSFPPRQDWPMSNGSSFSN
ncbi:hypothetical protein [Gloeothece verrucosa]|uniref:Uncharacterized protein n=1 Tax=Gloeothece verrucosa (strain PCC 7822) TaxID=497965 RepID=E0UAR9_GLOV7|nr:hypothetical protein [Gloeothece verrucosa]ADN13921.1 hypothetical protein Cyan7822_1938 [Gloeothece verrucosa PCC 7822]